VSDTQIDITRYTYRVTWSLEDNEYVATCLELPSLSWLAGTQEDALRGLREVIAEVVQDLSETDELVPEPMSSRSYSGKFNLRVGEQLHRRLALDAAEEQLSLNQYVVRRFTDVSGNSVVRFGDRRRYARSLRAEGLTSDDVIMPRAGPHSSRDRNESLLASQPTLAATVTFSQSVGPSRSPAPW